MISLVSSVQLEATLDVLNRKAADQKIHLEYNRSELEKLHQKMIEEKEDVEKLESESFKSTLFKFLNIHDGQLTKEQEEYLKAKLAFERKAFEVEEAERQLQHLESKITLTRETNREYKSALAERINRILALPIESPERSVYEKFVSKERAFKSQCVEINEAIEACKRAVQAKDSAKVLLRSAESWAFWDTWGGGGLITDMVKYEKIESVQVEFKRLVTELGHLKRELADVGESPSLEFTNIDSGTRTLDVWFDNIFTDHRVKEQIIQQIEAVQILETQLDKVRDTLEHKIQTAESGLRAATETLETVLMEA